MTTTPTIIFCHGSYHTPSPYQSLKSSLEARGYEVILPQLAISDTEDIDVDSPPPSGGWPTQADDARMICDLVKSVVKQGKRVLIVAHSSGGWTGTEAATLYEKSGGAGGIIGIFYICAYFPAPKESIDAMFVLFQSDQMGIFEVHAHGLEGLITIKDPAHQFFHDVPPSEAKRWAQTMTSSPRLTSESTAWPTVPCAYLVTEDDQTIPSAVQDKMVQRAKGAGVEVKEYRCGAGHSPYLSWTQGTVGVIENFVKGL